MDPSDGCNQIQDKKRPKENNEKIHETYRSLLHLTWTTKQTLEERKCEVVINAAIADPITTKYYAWSS